MNTPDGNALKPKESTPRDPMESKNTEKERTPDEIAQVTTEKIPDPQKAPLQIEWNGKTSASKESDIKTVPVGKQSTPSLTQADLLGGSFRSEMDAMIKMDDATFQKSLAEVEYRK
jgi:hypothetical protein